MDLINEVRDKGLTPDMPDEDHRGKAWQDVPEDKYPYWFGLGVVYEHFHTAKSNRSPTTRRLVPEILVFPRSFGNYCLQTGLKSRNLF